MLARKQSRSGRRADRAVCKSAFETKAAVGKSVDVGRTGEHVAIAADREAAQLVADDDDHVGLFCAFAGLGSDRNSRAGHVGSSAGEGGGRRPASQLRTTATWRARARARATRVGLPWRSCAQA